ncbi:MAG: GNAT family N-acetyltransferase [Chthoniobacterales bacterium]
MEWPNSWPTMISCVFRSECFSREQTGAFLDKVRARDREGLPWQFGVVFRENRQLIGYCGFFAQTVDNIEELEIGYRIDPSYWRRGIATEAARAVRDYALTELRLPALTLFLRSKTVADPTCGRDAVPFYRSNAALDSASNAQA